MVKMFPCSSYSALLARRMVLDSAHVFCELLRIEGALLISLQAWLTCIWNREKGFTFVKSLYSVFQFYLSTWYLNNDWLPRRSWELSLWAVWSWSLKFLRKWAARLTATCSQTNKPCGQTRSRKGPQCALSIQGELNKDLCMLEAFPCSCYGTFLAIGQALESGRACWFMSFANLSS